MNRLLPLLLLPLLSGCTTTEDEDGNKTTRFDSAAAIEVVRYGTTVYDRYREQPGYRPGVYQPAPGYQQQPYQP